MENTFRIIPSVREMKYLKYALSLENEYIQPTGAHIGSLQQWITLCHQAGKKVVVNHELIGGLGNDKMAFQMLKQIVSCRYSDWFQRDKASYDEKSENENNLPNFSCGLYFCSECIQIY